MQLAGRSKRNFSGTILGLSQGALRKEVSREAAETPCFDQKESR
jgi:hypothetical protein